MSERDMVALRTCSDPSLMPTTQERLLSSLEARLVLLFTMEVKTINWPPLESFCHESVAQNTAAKANR